MTTHATTSEKNRARRFVMRPAADVFENDDEILIIADVPGVAQEALSIDVHGGKLALRAESEGAVAYERQFRLPEGVDESQITAELKQGEVHLHLAKAEVSKPRRIPVEVS